MEVKVVYGNARLTFTLAGTEYTAVRGPDQQITFLTSGRISAYDYEAALLVALDAFKKMDQHLIFSMEKTHGQLGSDTPLH